MRFANFFADNQTPSFSFEVFPPKTDKGMEQLDRVLPQLVELQPTCITVTYGAMGTTQARTLDIASSIRQRFELPTASHLTCVGSTREEIDAILARLHDAGIENIVALRGDPPQGMERFEAPAGGFAHANELVAHIRADGRFGIAVAGYPEKHVEAPDLDTDLRYLKGKVEAGGDVVITQLFYDNEDFFRFRDTAHALGVAVPIVPGLLSIQSYQQIVRLTSMCGASIPPALRAALDAAGDDTERVQEIGTQWTIDQCRGLLDAGVPGIHFYVLNRAKAMRTIAESLRESGHWPAR